MEYVADLHIHSKESFDSASEPRGILLAAEEMGLNLIAVTDHGTIKGGLLTQEESLRQPDLNVTVIVGAEITTHSGDIIGLFLSKEITSKDPLEVINEIKLQGGISIYAHPFRDGQPDNEVLRQVDVVEIYNCRSSNRENLLAQNSAFKFGKPGIASSDAHKPEEIGKVHTIFELPDNLPLNARHLLTADIRPDVSVSK